MNTQWIVTANAASARIFRHDSKAEPLVAVATLVHNQSRLHARQLESDRPGERASDNSYGPIHFAPRADARRKEHQHFAKEIAQRLDAGLKAGEFSSLTLFASNPFMGQLKAQLSQEVAQRLKLTLNNDLSHAGIEEIERRISGT